MKIATLNIDWAKIYNSPNHFLKIEKFLNQQDYRQENKMSKKNDRKNGENAD